MILKIIKKLKNKKFYNFKTILTIIVTVKK